MPVNKNSENPEITPNTKFVIEGISRINVLHKLHEFDKETTDTNKEIIFIY